MKKKDFPGRCRSCVFFMKLYANEYICDYNSQKDKLRPCPRSENCTVYVPKGMQKLKIEKVNPFR